MFQFQRKNIFLYVATTSISIKHKYLLIFWHLWCFNSYLVSINRQDFDIFWNSSTIIYFDSSLINVSFVWFYFIVLLLHYAVLPFCWHQHLYLMLYSLVHYKLQILVTVAKYVFYMSECFWIFLNFFISFFILKGSPALLEPKHDIEEDCMVLIWLGIWKEINVLIFF